MEEQQTSTARLAAGMIHFDVGMGCTAEVLIGALADLCGDISSISEGLAACGIIGVQPSLRREARKSASGICVDFVLDSGFSLKSLSNSYGSLHPTPKRATFHRRTWDRREQTGTEALPASTPDAATTKAKKESLGQSDLFSSWTRGESFTLAEMSNIFESSVLSPVPRSLALKILTRLLKTLNEVLGHDGLHHPLPGPTGARLLCEIIALVQLLQKLDPLSVTATAVAVSVPTDLSNQGLEFTEEADWILVLSQGVPTIDRKWPAPFADIAALAFLSCVCGRFGARGESVLLKHGTGINSRISGPSLTAKALWCSPTIISSRADFAETSTPTPLPFVELSATLGQTIDLSDLIGRLSVMGMTSIHTWQVFENGTHPKTCLRGLLSYSRARDGVEALLITAEAMQVTTTIVESQTLQHKTVSVPYGHGQKMQVCKVNEWLWAGKILRADPDAHDLLLLAKSTGFAQEIVRADVLAAWRKWRQTESSAS